jgi:hypothetical protein
MLKFAAAGLAALGLIVTWSGAASAQTTFNVAAGHQVRVNWAISLNPDCTPDGQIVVRMTQPPQHGRVTIRNGRAFPNYPSSNIRNVCNTRRVPAVESYYRPEPGYTGFDSVSFETIFPGGSYRQNTANIQVR